jgi:predicted dehydrogenase
MGREFASAIARWCHLADIDVRPEIVAVCDRNVALFPWYTGHFASVKQTTTDYREVLANPEVEAVYVAVPHNLHQEIYIAAIEAGKHLMGEKPFGIDMSACKAIMEAIRKHPEVMVRCSSESPFFPAAQELCDMIEANSFGRIIEVNTGFLHASDLDPEKPINWKRMIEFNGEYGVMGDLGMHACHVGFRAGWQPRNVRAVLSDIMKERPDGKGGRVPCKTWDNSTLLCEAINPIDNEPFPWTIKLQRISPGQKNNWYIEILGTEKSVRWSSVQADVIEILEFKRGQEQGWSHIQTGFDTAFKTITGGIFQFGFTDSIQQMWAAFVYELAHGKPLKRYAGCVTPDEAWLSHRLFTAALASQRNSSTEAV